MRHFNPRNLPIFETLISDGGADCLCAIVAGLPVSIFDDVELSGGGEVFPRPDIAVSSPIPLGPTDTSDAPLLPIGGIEDPLDMYWGHRADYLIKNGEGQYVHWNKLASDDWNTLWVCFLPARYDDNDEKCKNAFLHTKVNGVTAFEGEIKSGSRSSRHTATQDPEPRLYVHEEGDKRIRLLGHWGSKVYYRNVVIRSVGSKE